jgi:cytochrome bd-I ubiquinol oxidase subunit X
MWYFAWILGLPLAAAFAVLNAMWYELMEAAPKAAPPRTRAVQPTGAGEDAT